MSLYYRRDGTPYPDGEQGLFEWVKDSGDRAKRIVKQERVGRFWISTVWLGLDHSYNCGKPLIFESMVFDKRRVKMINFFGNKRRGIGDDKEQVRYSSLDDALAGHAELAKRFKRKNKRQRRMQYL